MATRRSTQRKCAVNDCRNIVGNGGAKDFCGMHYTLFRRYGDPEERRGIRHGDAQRFLIKASQHKSKRCLDWPFALSAGYGTVSVKRVMHTASHAVCVIVYGSPPSPKHVASHSCDNRRCVAPAHLKWDTQKNNLIAAVQRKRTTTKVTAEVVLRMRALDGKLPRRQIALRFNLSVTQTHRILDRESWSWLK